MHKEFPTGGKYKQGDVQIPQNQSIPTGKYIQPQGTEYHRHNSPWMKHRKATAEEMEKSVPKYLTVTL